MAFVRIPAGSRCHTPNGAIRENLRTWMSLTVTGSVKAPPEPTDPGASQGRAGRGGLRGGGGGGGQWDLLTWQHNPLITFFEGYYALCQVFYVFCLQLRVASPC